MIFWNALGSRLFLSRNLDYRSLAGGLLGLLGLTLIFWQKLVQGDADFSTLAYVGLCLIATLSASAGNLLSASLQADGQSIWSTSAFGMIYGASVTIAASSLSGIPLIFDWSLIYVSSLAYLVLFGSVIAFGSYLTLIGQLGPEKAAYATILFPVIAILISTIFEDFQLSIPGVIGIGIVVFGNWLALFKPKTDDSACEARSACL